MKRRTNLQYRVALSFSLFGTVVSVLFGTGVYLAFHAFEQRTLDKTLEAELTHFLSHSPSPEPDALMVRGTAGDLHRLSSPPAGLAERPPGAYDLMLGGRPYRALVAEHAGRRYYLLHDTRSAVERDHYILALLASGVALVTLFSTLLGRRLARKVVRPVIQLADRVAAARAEDPPPPPQTGLFPDDEVGRLARVFDHHLRRLHGYIERERAFTAELSHELRTPLTVIRGAADVLLADGSLSARLRRRVERIGRAATEMCELTPALLTLAREDTRTGITADAAQEIHRLLDTHAYLLREKAIKLEVHIPDRLALNADPALLRVVLGNLIRNAFNYTAQGHIGVRLDEDGFTIADTGCGMDRERLEHLFERFQPKAAGNGIGLSLVKRICDLYGWCIAFDSNPDCGTTIRLHFPPEQAQLPATVNA